MTDPTDVLLTAGDPWADFLHYRAICIDWMFSNGKTPDEIARTLSMDPEQARLIAARHWCPFPILKEQV